MRKQAQDKEATEVAEDLSEQVLQAALDKGVLSTSTFPAVETKEPGKLVSQADGLDIVKKASNRKGCCLMLLACQLSLVPGGQLGELECMDTQTPLLYMSFPSGRFKLEGTFAYPKSRYTVLKLGSRQSVQLEHAFEHIIVFSKVTWVGTKEENPDEKALPFPEELKEVPEGDIRGPVVFGQGLGAESVTVRGSGQGATATPSKQRPQPARRSRAKVTKVVDSDESEEDEEEADGDSEDGMSDDAAEETAKKTPVKKTPTKKKPAKAAAKDSKKSPAKIRKTGGQKQAQAPEVGKDGPASSEETKRKREPSEQKEDAEDSPPAVERRSSARAAPQPKYAESPAASEDEEQESDDVREEDSESDFSGE